MSEVAPWMRSGLRVAPKAILEVSGDQEKLLTLKSFPLVCDWPDCGDLNASATAMVQRWLWLYSLRTTSKSPRCSLRFFIFSLLERVAVMAMFLPLGDQAKS